jgi:hypothetical protein
MPNSPFSMMNGIMQTIDMVKPKSILDIGVGFGRAGFLIREYFDLKPDKKKGYADWSMQIDGIEIFEKYLTPVHKYIYNDMFIGEALDILRNNNLYYDMILVLDVIEHFRKQDGCELIKLCKGRSPVTVISTPNIYYKQGAEFYNTYETHLSGWDYSDFVNLGCRYMWSHAISLIAIFTDRTLNLPTTDSYNNQILNDHDLQLTKDLMIMYFDTEQYDACIDVFNKYGAFHHNDYEPLLVTAACYEKKNDMVNALKYAEKALKINGTIPVAKEIIKRCKS